MAKHDLSEKRFKSLHRQLYGKQEEQRVSKPEKAVLSTKTFSWTTESSSTTNTTSLSDTVFFKKDLMKILFFSSIAIGFQVILYMLIQRGLKLPVG